MEGEIPFFRATDFKILDPEGSESAVKFFVFVFGENILTVSQSNGMPSIHFHQCKK